MQAMITCKRDARPGIITRGNSLNLCTSPFSHLTHQTVFMDQSQGEGVVINPRSILRMRIQRNEAVGTDLRFESNAQNTESYHNWVAEV